MNKIQKGKGVSEPMNEEATNITEQQTKKKKAIPFIIAAAVALIAIIAGIAIYNTPANRIQRQLDLGNKYLEEENYEQAAIAFEEAIAIDDRCIEAYVGGLEAYLGVGDMDGAQDLYDRTLAMLSDLDEDFLAENMDNAVELYLSADKVYGDERDKIAQVLEEGYTVTGEDARIKDKLIENYIEIGKKETQDGSYEDALAVYDRLLELDNTNEEVIADLSNCLTSYIEILIETEQYDKIRGLIQKYSDVASRIDFSDVLARIERLERSKEWVEISPSLFDFRMMGFDLWEEHYNEILEALLPLAKSEVFGSGSSSPAFYMENDVWIMSSDKIIMPTKGGAVKGKQIIVEQNGSYNKGIYGKMEYNGGSDQVWFLIGGWNGLYSPADKSHRIAPMEFEKFIDCPIGKTSEEWYSMISIEQIKEKGQQVEVDDYLHDGEAWRFQTEWGDGYYFESGGERRWCELAIDCSGQGEEKKVFSVQLIIEPDEGIGNIDVCVGRNYAWNNRMYSEIIPDVFQIYE